jgi:hypothetical protein
MSAKADLLVVGGVALALVIAAWYVKSKVEGLVNSAGDVVLDTWEAAKTVVKEVPENVVKAGKKSVVLVMDVSGLDPDTKPDGTKTWEKTLPWDNKDNPVADNDSGMNYGLF